MWTANRAQPKCQQKRGFDFDLNNASLAANLNAAISLAASHFSTDNHKILIVKISKMTLPNYPILVQYIIKYIR